MSASGSFPLMAIAADFGVDYGDVLEVADLYRMTVRRQPVPRGRALNENRAACRIQRKVGVRGLSAIKTKVAAHALGRWA